MSESRHNRVGRGFGVEHVGGMSSAGRSRGSALLSNDDGQHNPLALGLLLDSAEGLRLASELAADQQARVMLTRHVEELMALSETCRGRRSAELV